MSSGFYYKAIRVAGGSLVCLLLVFLFQNCSSVKTTTNNKVLGGGGVDEKRYVNYGVCPGGLIDVKTVVAVSQEFTQATLKRQNCQDLAQPMPIESTDLKFASLDTSVMQLNGDVFDLQTNSGSQKVTIQFCQSMGVTPSVQAFVWQNFGTPNSYFGSITPVSGAASGTLLVQSVLAGPGEYITIPSQASQFDLHAAAPATLTYAINGGAQVNVPIMSCFAQPAPNLQDGSANAPAGPAPHPSLLFGYAVRPPWNVAGVDYAVGFDATANLQDPVPGGALAASLSAQGCSLSGVDINCNLDNQTISSWDFALHGGYALKIFAKNITIKNNNFALGANNTLVTALIGLDIAASNVTIVNNVLNGNGIINAFAGRGLIDSAAMGTISLEYNWIRDSFTQAVILASKTTSGFNVIARHNLIENAGMSGNSGIWIELYNDPGATINSAVIDYNTFTQTAPISVARTQGITFPSTGQVLSESVSNNTFVVLAQANVNYAIEIDPSYLNGSATVANNYFDVSGVGTGGGGWWITESNLISGNPGPYNGTISTSGNFDMLNGAPLTP